MSNTITLAGLSQVITTYKESLQQQKLGRSIANSKNNTYLKGLVGSSISIVIANAFRETELPFLLVLNDKEEAAYHLNDLEQLIGEKDVLFYPGSYRRPYQIEETDNANILLRAEVLNRINSRKKPAIIVTYPEALFEKVVTKKELERSTLKINLNDKLSIDFINETLFEYKFKRVDFVTEPGEFSVRGGIVDVFSFSNDEPYRIEFFGEEVDSIRTFDVETQLSTEKLKKINIIPNVENKFLEEERESFLKYVSAKTVVFSRNSELLFSRIDGLFSKAEEAFTKLSKEIKHAPPKELFCDGALLKNQLKGFITIHLSAPKANDIAYETILFNTTPQPSFNKQFDLLIEDLNSNHEKGYKNYIYCVSEQQAKRFHDIFDDVDFFSVPSFCFEFSVKRISCPIVLSYRDIYLFFSTSSNENTNVKSITRAAKLIDIIFFSSSLNRNNKTNPNKNNINGILFPENKIPIPKMLITITVNTYLV